MENLDKIDPTLLAVDVAEMSQRKVNCVIWVRDFWLARDFLKSVFAEGVVVGEYPFLNAFGLCVNSSDMLKLSNFAWVEYVSSVQRASVFLDKAKKDIEIEELHRQGIFGAGVSVAILDTGCYPHLDFMLGRQRIRHFVDFVGTQKQVYDDNGHGTFVAGVLAGSGLTKGGKYAGVAPASELVILKALDHSGETQAFTILNAMQWLYDNHNRHNIRVACMSFGSVPLSRNDPLMAGAEALWDDGVVVVGACGNDGPTEGTIKSPGACPKIITVGSADVIAEPEQAKVAEFSSRGPSFNFVKPDLIAPGVDITSTDNSVKFYTQMSGTSVSTPFVAGVAALLLSQSPYLSPNHIKGILMQSATRLKEDRNSCGSGLLSAARAFWYR